jgi:hypothetical protein
MSLGVPENECNKIIALFPLLKKNGFGCSNFK